MFRQRSKKKYEAMEYAMRLFQAHRSIPRLWNFNRQIKRSNSQAHKVWDMCHEIVYMEMGIASYRSASHLYRIDTPIGRQFPKVIWVLRSLETAVPRHSEIEKKLLPYKNPKKYFIEN